MPIMLSLWRMKQEDCEECVPELPGLYSESLSQINKPQNNEDKSSQEWAEKAFQKLIHTPKEHENNQILNIKLGGRRDGSVVMTTCYCSSRTGIHFPALTRWFTTIFTSFRGSDIPLRNFTGTRHAHGAHTIYAGNILTCIKQIR